MAGSQITIPASQLDAQRLGYAAISLTHFADLLEPQIAAGSKVEIGGALFQFAADESITGWGGIGNNSGVYIKLTVSGSSVTASFTTTAPTWSTSKQGWYSGNDRYVGGLWKDGSGNYYRKFFYCFAQGQYLKVLGTGEVGVCTGLSFLAKKVVEIGDWNMDADPAVNVTHGVDWTKIRAVSACVRDDGPNKSYPTPCVEYETGSIELGVNQVYGTVITLMRKTNGYFDSTWFDSVGYNRGWVTIEYEI